MKLQNHWMLDIETLGIGNNAVVTQIAAKQFANADENNNFHFIENPELVFNEYLDISHQLRYDRKIEEETLKWWVKTNPSKLIEFFKSNKSIYNQLKLLDGLLSSHDRDTIIWARDPDFDCRILGHLYDQYGVALPWHFANTRSHRTVLALAGVKHTPNGAHDALEDVCAQINSLKQSLYILQEGK